MPTIILETLLLDLGPAVAKSILKVWLKDNDLAQDVSGSLVDLLKKKMGGTLARNRPARQLDDIAGARCWPTYHTA